MLAIRFSGSDMPDTGQAYSRAARNTLRDLLVGLRCPNPQPPLGMTETSETGKNVGSRAILPAQNNTVPVMPHSTVTWLDHQSADVRAELSNLIAYQPEPEFISLLAECLPVIPCPGLIDLYYDIWHCVPSRQALRIAINRVHTPEELSSYLALTERVLIDGPACEDFDGQFSEDDDLGGVIFWLERKTGR